MTGVQTCALPIFLRLTGTNDFGALCPIIGNVKLTRGITSDWESLKFIFKDVDFESSSNGVVQKLASYETGLMFGDKLVRTQTFAVERHKIATIGVPVPFWACKEIPFKTIRDFNHAHLMFGVSSNLVPKLKTVEFIVNGWALFHKDAKSADWRHKNDFCELLADKGDSKHPPVAVFELTTHSEVLPFYDRCLTITGEGEV